MALPSDTTPVIPTSTPFVIPTDDVTLNAYNNRLEQLNDDRSKATDSLNDLNAKLSESKWGHREALKKSIRNVEQQIRQIDRSIRTQEGKISSYILALQGQNSTSQVLGSTANLVGQTASVVGSVMGLGGLSAMVGAHEDTKQGQQATDRTQITASADAGKSKNNMIMVAAAAVVLLLIMKKK